MNNVIALPVSGVDESSTGPREQKKKLGLVSTAPWKWKFKFEGKTYSLVKRSQTRDGSWWLDVTIKGQRIPRSLDTNNGDAAAERAVRDYIKPAKDGKLVKVEKIKEVAMIGQVLDAYRVMSHGAMDAGTVHRNCNQFRAVVRRGLGDDKMSDDAVRALSAVVLTGKLVSDFEAFMLRLGEREGRNKESTKRSVSSYLRQARSVFKEINMPKFAEHGVHLPDLKEFMGRKTERAARMDRVPPSDELLAKTFAAAKVLRHEDRAAYVAWLLGSSTLRRKEARFMRWDWVQTMDGCPMVKVPATFGPAGMMVKSKCERLVPLDENVLRELNEWKGMRVTGSDDPDEVYVIPGRTMNGEGVYRADSVFKRVDEWMRGLGWATSHTLHEMRAVTLQVVQDEHGLSKAAAVAGHEDERTTKNHYVGKASVRGLTVSLPMFGKKAKKEDVGTSAALMEIIKGLQAELAALRAERAAGV